MHLRTAVAQQYLLEVKQEKSIIASVRSEEKKKSIAYE